MLQSRMGPRPTAPGLGTQAAGAAKVVAALSLLNAALAQLHPGSYIWDDAHKATGILKKHAQMGGGQPEQTMFQDMQRNSIRNQRIHQLMQQRQQGQQPMQPSQPLPGS